MDILRNLIETLQALLPTAVVIALAVLVLIGVHYLLRRRYQEAAGQDFKRQVFTLVVALVGVLLVLIVLPIRDELRGQLLSLLGILLTAAIALSATTFVGNIMAGLMLRSLRNFRPGDFIRVGEHFGRVSERGLFHVEIQTEDRDLTTLPNLFLVTNPVKVVRSSGTLVSAEVSLGYDVPRRAVERLLTEAAGSAKLEEPFVYVMGLGDYSVTYRVAGLLTDVKHVISVRSHLRQMMLDKLHEGGVEIVSPTFMNTRALAEGRRFVPPVSAVHPVDAEGPEAPKPEELVFDKADEAESLEKLRERYGELSGELESHKKTLDRETDDSVKTELRTLVDGLQARRARIGEYIKRLEAETKE